MTVTDLLTADHPIVVGVLNVTPDSFFDGGRYADLDAAVAHAVEVRHEGADLVDVGGESTRPGADRVDAGTELRRVLPVIRELAALRVPMSIDTTRATVAAAALEAGVSVVNDVSGGLADPDMARVVADAGCPWIGVAADRLVLDPGLGFAKTAEHNWQLSAHLDTIVALGFPVLVGTSHKSYLGSLLAGPDGTPRPVEGRGAATVATSLLAVAAGAWGVRVHDVRDTVDALRVWQAVEAHR